MAFYAIRIINAHGHGKKIWLDYTPNGHPFWNTKPWVIVEKSTANKLFRAINEIEGVPRNEMILTTFEESSGIISLGKARRLGFVVMYIICKEGATINDVEFSTPFLWVEPVLDGYEQSKTVYEYSWTSTPMAYIDHFSATEWLKRYESGDGKCIDYMRDSIAATYIKAKDRPKGMVSPIYISLKPVRRKIGAGNRRRLKSQKQVKRVKV